MAIATLSLITQEALELHFEGTCYGPIFHTQALGALLFALQPDDVELATCGGAFEDAMAKVLRAAHETSMVLEAATVDGEGALNHQVSAETLAVWIGTCCQAAPPQEVESLYWKILTRLGHGPWGIRTLH